MSYTRFYLILILTLIHLAAKADGVDFSFSRACESKSSQITLAFTGDVLVHDALYKSAMASPDGFYSLFRKTTPLLNKADFTYGNLEGPVAMGIDRDGRDHGDVGKTYDLNIYSGTNFSFNYHPSILKDLARAGFDLMSTVNNHALDRGAIGVDRTIEAFKQSSLQYVGTRASYDRGADLYRITQIKDFKVAWLGCTEMTNGNPDRKSQMLFCFENETLILNTVRELSSRADIDAVIVTPHWGDEYQPVNSRQKALAHKILEAGAAAIIGSHPHILQSWEKYTTSDGRETLVAYSLGNFLAFQASLPKKTGAVVYLGLAKNSLAKAFIFGATYTPVYRDGYEVFPISDTGVLNHAAQFLGTQNRRSLAQALWPLDCR